MISIWLGKPNKVTIRHIDQESTGPFYVMDVETEGGYATLWFPSLEDLKKFQTSVDVARQAAEIGVSTGVAVPHDA